jgi:ABC-type uncharacterized transport system auxiliary subunit
MRILLIMVAACALTSKSAPQELHYFAPPAHAVATAHGSGTPLRIGRVTPSALLRERIVYRTSNVELDRYETLRWTDAPDVYVRRALASALFDTKLFEQAAGPVLDVEVIAFEELRRGDRRFGRVELGYTLEDDTHVLARGTVAIERDAGSSTMTAIVTALGAALDAAAAELAARLCPPR